MRSISGCSCGRSWCISTLTWSNDLTAVRSLGFNEKISTADSWKLAFKQMRMAKIIPANPEIGQ